MSVDILNSPQQLIDRIRSGDPKFLEQLYQQLKPGFISWASQHFSTDQELSTEIYHRSFTALYLNIRNGKLIELTSSLRTYLYSIARNLFYQQYREQGKHKIVDLDDNSTKDLVTDNILDQYHNQDEKILVQKLLNTIGDPCKTLLTLAFVHGYNHEAIAEEMGYSDDRVARKRKCLCLKKMRELMQIEMSKKSR